MLPGKQIIKCEVFKRLSNHSKLLSDITAEKLMMVILSNIGWYWDVEDVGTALVHIRTQYECSSAFEGLKNFVQLCMIEYKNKENE